MQKPAFKKIAKAVLPRLALGLVLLAAYFAAFIAFEPYNYFNVQRHNATAPDQLIYRARQFVENPQNAIIVGDSRLAHLDMELVQSLAGQPVSNLAFGGAAEREVLDLCDFALKVNPDINTIYCQVSFYILNAGYERDRVSNLETVLTQPLAYLCNVSYHLEMINRVRQWVRGEDLGPEHETAWDAAAGALYYTAADYQDTDGSPLAYRRQLMEYNDTIRPVCENWQLNQPVLDRLLALADTCREKGIRLVFVLPPMADSVYEEIVAGFDILPAMQQVVAALQASGAEVLDFEITDRPDFDESWFFDGFHVDITVGLPTLTQMIFGGKDAAA